MEKWAKLAEAVRRIHIAIVIFVAAASFLPLPVILIWSRCRGAGMPKWGWTLILLSALPSLVIQVSQLIWRGCPLTLLENSFRARAGGKEEPMRSFVSDLVRRKLNRDISPESVIIIGLILLAVSLIAPACVVIARL